MNTARALRRNLHGGDNFPEDVAELMSYLDEPADGARVRAVPGQGTQVPVWILGSSLFGAQFAAYMGLPYAFASHFAPQMLEEALNIYRSTFRPSKSLDKPYAMMAAGVCAAETDEEAAYLRSSQILSFARLRTGNPGKLPRPVHDLADQIPAQVMVQVEAALSCSATGDPQTVRRQLARIVDRYKPDELMVTGMIHDHSARCRSFTIAAEALCELQSTPV